MIPRFPLWSTDRARFASCAARVTPPSRRGVASDGHVTVARHGGAVTADVTIGVHVYAEPARLAATLVSLDRSTAVPYRLVLLADGPDAATAAAVAATGLPVSGTDRPA